MSNAKPESLTGRVALVTGSARRIGAAIATTLHAAGARIAVHYRTSRTEADTLCERFNSERKDSAIAFQADLNEQRSPGDLVEEIVAQAGRLDFLINNASTFYPTPLAEISEANWSDLIGSNLKAPLFLCKAAAPHIRANQGNIVNIIDIHARRPLRDHLVYGAAKAGLAMLTRSLAKDLAPDVRVNGVAPGAITWPENGMTETTKQRIIDQIPLGRAGTPADIANAVLFLVRDATYVTGQVIRIDGGRAIGW